MGEPVSARLRDEPGPAESPEGEKRLERPPEAKSRGDKRPWAALTWVRVGCLSLPWARRVHGSMQVSANMLGPSPGGLLAWAKDTDQFVAEKRRCEHNQMVSLCAYCSNEARTRDQNPGRVPTGKAGALPETRKHTVVTSTETPIAAEGRWEPQATPGVGGGGRGLGLLLLISGPGALILEKSEGKGTKSKQQITVLPKMPKLSGLEGCEQYLRLHR